VSPVGTLAWSREVTQRKYFVEPHIREFAQFPRWYGKKVLEVGCGIGTDTLEFVRAGAKVVALDLSDESLKIAANRFDVEGLWFRKTDGAERKISFWHANAENHIPLKNYDLAYSFGVLHHTPRPELVLRNIYEALKPGGELRIMLYARLSAKFLLDEQPEAQAGCPIVRTYTGLRARSLLNMIGFQVESVSKAHIFPWRVEDYVHHRYVKRWPYRLMPAKVFSILERVAGHHLLIVARKPKSIAWWPS
jgi:SAM-dependent methyltransferase